MLFRSAPLEAKQQTQQSIRNAEKMIRAAATKSPFQSTRGTFYITHELVDRVLAGLDGSFSRANQLINPRWGQALQEYKYPEAHVAILSSTPFSVEKKTISAHGGRSVEMTMLTNTVDDNSMVLMSFYSTPKTVDGDSILRIAKSTIAGSGASPSGAYSTNWREKTSALSSGVGNNSDGEFFVSTRVVLLKDIQAILSFMAVSAISRSEAEFLREQLEQSTQILD